MPKLAPKFFCALILRVAITPREWCVGGVVNIGVDIKFIAEQRKHRNAIMSLLVRLISRTLWRYTAHNPVVPMQILRNINGSMMKNYMEITHLSMIINYPVIALD